MAAARLFIVGPALLRGYPLPLLLFRPCSTVGLPVIRIPRGLQLRAAPCPSGRPPPRSPRLLSALPGRLLLSSRRPQLSQHLGTTLRRLGPPPRLVSGGWKHRLSAGDHFTVNSTCRSAPSLPAPGEGMVAGFEALGVGAPLAELLEAKGFRQPTEVQSQALPPLLKGCNVLCAAETGSGKTLAYVLPLLQRLLGGGATERKGDASGLGGDSLCFGSDHTTLCMPTLRTVTRDGGPPGRADGPRALRSADGLQALVLLPSRELADQVHAVAATFARPFGLRVKSIGGGRGMGRVHRTLSGHADVLVATPGALCKALRRDFITLHELRFLVLDEADTLCDDSFKDLVEEVLRQVNIAAVPAEAVGFESKAQLAVVGATFPKGVGELLAKFTDLGTIHTLKSKRLHFLMPHIKQKFMKVKNADKLIELLEMLKKQTPGEGVLVFCNSAGTVNWLGYMLDAHTIKHSRLQGQMPAEMRVGIFNTFQKGLTDVLVCTDIASRGLDSTRVEVVINYDFPPTLQDYIHRAGRVGRVGSKHLGTVVSFVTHKWDVELVQKIETAARRRTSLPGMESKIKPPIPKTDLI